jgi:hypothetical protein
MKKLVMLMVATVAVLLVNSPVSAAPKSSVELIEGMRLYLVKDAKIPEIDLNELTMDQSTVDLETLKEHEKSSRDEFIELMTAFGLEEKAWQKLAAKLK